MKFFMGEAFKATRGRADGNVIEECMRRMIMGDALDTSIPEGR